MKVWRLKVTPFAYFGNGCQYLKTTGTIAFKLFWFPLSKQEKQLRVYNQGRYVLSQPCKSTVGSFDVVPIFSPGVHARKMEQ
jgi:hypothetical protein